MQNIRITILLLFFIINANAQHKELGNVQWLRDYNQAITKAKKEQKDVLILFQEVPGCSTCQRYGQGVLSDPIFVEIIETHYVPLAIFNNKNGKDREILNKYKEPSWNNPVLRIVNSNGDPTSGRLSGGYSKAAVISYLHDDLSKKGSVPQYISIINDEHYAAQEGTKEITLSMYCFWTGEKELGSLEGVVNTTAGFMDGREVVTVAYNPSLVSPDHIVKRGQKVKCADGVYTSDKSTISTLDKYKISYKKAKKFRADKDQNYYLKNSKYGGIQMSDMQAMKVNAALGKRQNPEQFLSPRQLGSI